MQDDAVTQADGIGARLGKNGPQLGARQQLGRPAVGLADEPAVKWIACQVPLSDSPGEELPQHREPLVDGVRAIELAVGFGLPKERLDLSPSRWPTGQTFGEEVGPKVSALDGSRRFRARLGQIDGPKLTHGGGPAGGCVGAL